MWTSVQVTVSVCVFVSLGSDFSFAEVHGEWDGVGRMRFYMIVMGYGLHRTWFLTYNDYNSTSLQFRCRLLDSSTFVTLPLTCTGPPVLAYSFAPLTTVGHYSLTSLNPVGLYSCFGTFDHAQACWQARSTGDPGSRWCLHCNLTTLPILQWL